MIKTYLSILFFITAFSFSVNAQNVAHFESFDKIPLGSKQNQVETFMSALAGFTQSKVTDAWAEIEYLGLEYKGPKNEDIVLLFYNGVLYQKQLVLNYTLSEQSAAKDEYLNLKKYISSANKPVGTEDEVISNEVYGSQIGESTSYYLDNSAKSFKKKRAGFSAKLESGYDDIARKPTAKLTGYKVSYESTDLSKTELDTEKGFRSYQL